MFGNQNRFEILQSISEIEQDVTVVNTKLTLQEISKEIAGEAHVNQTNKIIEETRNAENSE